jgi:tetratricopeptide (TPR) repeat protein
LIQIACGVGSSLGRLGETAGSLADASMAFAAALAAARRAGDERDESVALNCVGDVLVAQGNLAEALRSFRDGLLIAERLAQSDPGNAGWQRDLAVSHERIGDVEEKLKHPAEARAAFGRALAIYESLLRSNPENTYFLVSSTVPLMRLGDLDADRGNAYFERAFKILKDLDAAGRLEPRRKGSIAWLESRLGRG